MQQITRPQTSKSSPAPSVMTRQETNRSLMGLFEPFHHPKHWTPCCETLFNTWAAAFLVCCWFHHVSGLGGVSRVASTLTSPSEGSCPSFLSYFSHGKMSDFPPSPMQQLSSPPLSAMAVGPCESHYCNCAGMVLGVR